MTRKDYVVLARAIKGARSVTSGIRQNGVLDAQFAIEKELVLDNAGFDVKRFREACDHKEGK